MADEWRETAACRNVPSRVFFEDAFPENDEGNSIPDPAGVARARAFCARCPVRLQCHEDTTRVEAGYALYRRFGIFAGLTPGQRYSLWRRDSWRCDRCLEVYDPQGIVAGDAVCSCGWFSEPPIPDEGDLWFPRHDLLLERFIAWLVDNTEPGDRVPPPYKMLEILGYRRKDDMPLIYARLLDDGLLERGEGRAVWRKAGKAAFKVWRPPAKRRYTTPTGPYLRVGHEALISRTSIQA